MKVVPTTLVSRYLHTKNSTPTLTCLLKGRNAHSIRFDTLVATLLTANLSSVKRTKTKIRNVRESTTKRRSSHHTNAVHATKAHKVGLCILYSLMILELMQLFRGSIQGQLHCKRFRAVDQIVFIVLIPAKVFPTLLHHAEPFQVHQPLLVVGVRIRLSRFPHQYLAPISRGQKIERRSQL